MIYTGVLDEPLERTSSMTKSAMEKAGLPGFPSSKLWAQLDLCVFDDTGYIGSLELIAGPMNSRSEILIGAKMGNSVAAPAVTLPTSDELRDRNQGFPIPTASLMRSRAAVVPHRR